MQMGLWREMWVWTEQVQRTVEGREKEEDVSRRLREILNVRRKREREWQIGFQYL